MQNLIVIFIQNFQNNFFQRYLDFREIKKKKNSKMINKIGSGNNSKFYLSIIYTVSFLYCNGSSFSCYDYVDVFSGWLG